MLTKNPTEYQNLTKVFSTSLDPAQAFFSGHLRDGKRGGRAGRRGGAPEYDDSDYDPSVSDDDSDTSSEELPTVSYLEKDSHYLKAEIQPQILDRKLRPSPPNSNHPNPTTPFSPVSHPFTTSALPPHPLNPLSTAQQIAASNTLRNPKKSIDPIIKPPISKPPSYSRVKKFVFRGIRVCGCDGGVVVGHDGGEDEGVEEVWEEEFHFMLSRDFGFRSGFDIGL
ncbi:hypothetical protein BDZ45DRAFT_750500 [Acephala macrosclerotiorum]|nr:hypothetical protein BDZ45DRAFT_750500 [Acephala macrosclerotiorum]